MSHEVLEPGFLHESSSLALFEPTHPEILAAQIRMQLWAQGFWRRAQKQRAFDQWTCKLIRPGSYNVLFPSFSVHSFDYPGGVEKIRQLIIHQRNLG